MRLVVAECQVDYIGRLSAHLPMARRLLLVKADGSVSVHADDRAYKPLNWMSPPCTLSESQDDEHTVLGGDEQGRRAVASSNSRPSSTTQSGSLGRIPGLVKDGVEAHLQELLAEHIETARRRLDAGAPGVHDRDRPGGPAVPGCRAGPLVAVEIKRRGEIDGVEQLTRYLELLNRDPLLAPVTGVFAAQEIKPQARTLAQDRGIRCVEVDYDHLRGYDDVEARLF